MDKEFATLRAKFALRGFTLIQTKSGYVINRWNLVKHFNDKADLLAFLKQVGGDA